MAEVVEALKGLPGIVVSPFVGQSSSARRGEGEEETVATRGQKQRWAGGGAACAVRDSTANSRRS